MTFSKSTNKSWGTFFTNYEKFPPNFFKVGNTESVKAILDEDQIRHLQSNHSALEVELENKNQEIARLREELQESEIKATVEVEQKFEKLKIEGEELKCKNETTIQGLKEEINLLEASNRELNTKIQVPKSKES